MSKLSLPSLTSWLLPVLSIIVVTAVSATLIYPWAKDAFAKRTEIAEKKTSLDEVLQPKLKLLETLDKEMLRSQLGKLEIILPSSIQTPYIFANIEKLAAENEVSVEGLSFVSQDAAKTEAVELHFIASGNSDSLINFVKTLEKSAPLFGVESYNQTKNEEKPDQTTISMLSFYKTLPEKVGEVREPLTAWTKKEIEALGKAEEFTVLTVGISEESVAPTVPLGKQNPF